MKQKSSLLLCAILIFAVPSLSKLHIPLQRHHFSSLTQSNPHRLLADSLDYIRSLNFHDSLYLGNISLGTTDPARNTFLVMFDTGSANLWVADSSSENPAFPKKYDCSASPTCEVLDMPPKALHYGSGTISGYFVKETVNLGSDFKIHDQIMLLSQEQDVPPSIFQGIMGMGFSSLANGIPTYLDNLQKQGIIEDRVFSLYASNDPAPEIKSNSELIIGGYDQKYMMPGVTEFEFFPVVEGEYWALSLEGYRFGDVRASIEDDGTHRVLLDSGTSLLGVSESFFYQVADSVNSQMDGCRVENVMSCPCMGINDDRFPDLNVKLGGKEYSIPPSQYLLPQGPGRCIIGLMGLPDEMNLWILGDVFLKTYYTIFNADRRTIGIARSNPHPNEDTFSEEGWYSTEQGISLGDMDPSNSKPVLIAIICITSVALIGLVVYLIAKRRKNIKRDVLIPGPLNISFAEEQNTKANVDQRVDL